MITRTNRDDMSAVDASALMLSYIMSSKIEFHLCIAYSCNMSKDMSKKNS